MPMPVRDGFRSTYTWAFPVKAAGIPDGRYRLATISTAALHGDTAISWEFCLAQSFIH